MYTSKRNKLIKKKTSRKSLKYFILSILSYTEHRIFYIGPFMGKLIGLLEHTQIT